MPAKNFWPALLLCLGLVACGEPIVPRTPEAFYNLAKQQLNNGQYRAASDSLQRVTETDPTGELGQRALVLRTALLAGMTAGFQRIGEDHLAGYKQTQSPQLRVVAMDYFSRARGRSLELVDVLEQTLKQPTTSPFHVDYWPAPATGAEALKKPRQGQLLSDTELETAERAAVQSSLAEALSTLTGQASAPGAQIEVQPAVFFLGAAQVLMRLTDIFRPEALDDRRMAQLLHERAATLARQAGQLAQSKGDQKTQTAAEQLLQEHEGGPKKR